MSLDTTDPIPPEIRERLKKQSEHDELLMLRDAIQAANNVVLLTDPSLPDNPIVYVNDGFERLTGYPRDEVLGKNCRFLQGSDRDQQGVILLRQAIAERRGVQVELKNYRKDGTLFWNELYITPVFRNGVLVNFMGVQNDITARKEAEAAQEQFRQAVESASDAIMITEVDFELPGPRITYVNRAFTRMSGYSFDEVVGQTPRMFQGPKTNRTVLDRMKRRLRQGRSFEGEIINYRKDGSSYVMAWTISPIHGAGGKLTSWVSTQHDVTERRRLERETLNISAREQRRIAGDLHDALQQQLIGTSMHAGLLKQRLESKSDEETGSARELYEMTRDGIQSLRTVIRGVAPVSPDPQGLMVALEGLCQRTRELYGVACTLSYEAPLQLRDAELATQLYYLAQEAVTNAIKHAAPKSIEMSLARANGHMALAVRDDGRGFDSEHQPRSDGLGLRLMSYRARLIGADFELTSAPGGGTVVICSFEAA